MSERGHQLARRQHGRCGSKTSDSGHEQGQSARQKRAISGLMRCDKFAAVSKLGHFALGRSDQSAKASQRGLIIPIGKLEIRSISLSSKSEGSRR